MTGLAERKKPLEPNVKPGAGNTYSTAPDALPATAGFSLGMPRKIKIMHVSCFCPQSGL